MRTLFTIRNGKNWPLCYYNKTRDGIGYGFLGCLPRSVMFVSNDRANKLLKEIEANPKFTMPPYTAYPMNESKIVSVRIVDADFSEMKFMSTIFVNLEDEPSETILFDYYPDEISFNEKELIGLTFEQAKHLKFEKDKQFLQS